MASSCVLGDAMVCMGASSSRHCAPRVHTATDEPHRAAVALLSCCREAVLAGEGRGALG